MTILISLPHFSLVTEQTRLNDIADVQGSASLLFFCDGTVSLVSFLFNAEGPESILLRVYHSIC